MSDYINYKNIKKYKYQNGVAVYASIERVSNIPSIAPAKDSVIYEYTALPLRADFFNTGMPVSLFGKPDKYLLKKPLIITSLIKMPYVKQWSMFIKPIISALFPKK
ncbi:hypothetical protein [Niabella hibiscisoli]|uniref:hypothetical protein n=1 Tax=Niabella hibiscisoli TaxID=1825928 RepID=UPI001F10759D|nr:hypothetical protein [Niabella hibiscisoli]MCH5715610.1 hypothetical protein [Niabella hibiscisoli]